MAVTVVVVAVVVAERTSNCNSIDKRAGDLKKLPAFCLSLTKIIIMKIHSIVLAIAAAAVLASCCGKVSDVTEISGTVNLDGITEVNFHMAGVVDTLVPVTDGKFAISLPVDLTKSVRVMAGNGGVMLVSDGTPLTVVLDEESKVTSKYPKISVQERLNKYNADEKALMKEYRAKQEEIFADSLMTDEEKSAKFEEFFDGFIGGYEDHHKSAVAANTDNFVSILALNNLRGQVEDEEMTTLIGSLAPEVLENEYVQRIKSALEARVRTAEGTKFVDFTVNSVVGMTRSIPPQPKYAEVKFSDFVGKGTYVLVDFWSPWCGPCKREIPNIKKVYEQYKDKGFEVLSIAVWERKPVQVTIDTAAELGMDWLHINNAGSVPTDIYGIEGIPHLMLIGPDGTILKRGFHGLEGIEAAVAEYIK